jgi:signal peptidase II
MFGYCFRKCAAGYGLAAFVLVLDRFLKVLATPGYLPDSSILGDWFSLSFAKNYGIAFSLPVYGFGLEILIGVILAALAITWIRFVREKKAGSIWLFALILGAASNLWDRLMLGYVVDYFDLRFFTVFNLADCMIVLSAGWFVVYEIKKTRQGGSKDLSDSEG